MLRNWTWDTIGACVKTAVFYMMGDSVAGPQFIGRAVVYCGDSWAAHRLAYAAVFRSMALTAVVMLLTGCGIFGRGEPTRTPVPTFTPTPILVVVPAGSEPAAAETAVAASPAEPVAPPPTATPQSPPTATPEPPTSTPTITPTVTPTYTPEPTATPTIEPTPTPPPEYRFDLEAAQKFPTESLAPNVVRIYAYIYSPTEFGLEGYSLSVRHNGAELAVDQESTGGLPRVTRDAPGPYSRFTNLTAIFVETQAGDWVVQLVDADGNPAGPPATFQLSSEENTRELYVRYRLEGG